MPVRPKNDLIDFVGDFAPIAAPFLPPGTGAIVAAAGGLANSQRGGGGAPGGGIQYPGFPPQTIDPIFQNLPNYYNPTYRPPDIYQNQILPNVEQSLQPRPTPGLDLPVATQPEAGRELYEGILGGQLSSQLPGKTALGTQVEGLLSSRLATGGGPDPALLARGRELIARQTAQERDRGRLAATEDLSARGLATEGMQFDPRFMDLEERLQLQAGQQQLELEIFQETQRENSAQVDIQNAIAMSDYDRAAQIENDRYNRNQQLGAAGILSAQESNVQNINQQRVLAERGFIRDADMQDVARISETSLALMEYFDNRSAADQAQSLSTMLTVLGDYLGVSASNAQTQLQAWTQSEKFVRADDQSYMNMMSNLGAAYTQPKQPAASTPTPTHTPVPYASYGNYGIQSDPGGSRFGPR